MSTTKAAMAHPAAQDLYGHGYLDEPFINGASRTIGRFNEGPGKLWSVRNYKSLLPQATWLPESHRNAWLYFVLFPSAVISLYPDSVALYQELPDAVGNTRHRGAIYLRADESGEMRAAR